MIIPVNNKIIVEKLEKAKDTEKETPFSSFGQFLHMNSNLGTIISMDDTNLTKYGVRPGAQVYFGPKHEKIFMEGREVLVMDFDNVFAVVRLDNNE